MHNGVNEFTLREEVWHAITHGVGFALSIAGLVVLVIYSNSTISITSSAIFGAALITLYASSTLYHAIKHIKLKKVLQVFDHISIYLLIAGSYTPITLLVLQGTWGWSIFAVVWSLAALGIILKILYPNRFETFSLILYVIMGWTIVVALNPLFENMTSEGLWLLLLGGLSYTFGVIFYVWDKLPYNHAIWHIFVLVGSLFHYFMVLFYVI
ncbi:COG1272: Predicted membrane protein hemolysin III homolog [hydrothermal vent metagenome]|uniref:COG1272: Predicted membrane protein hemolysin III homolog n=1 Tax=hydrothermal vent metagenome TaxID=652676 RepID=A0A1W1EEU6_9ZZZZ